MTVSHPTISEPLSVFLDLLRVGAALAVLAGHVERSFALDLGPIADHSGEAVAVFFVLSGLLIADAADRPSMHWLNFASARLARLYSVVLVVVPFGLFLDWLGATHDPDHYGFAPTSALDVLRTLVFANELWFSHVVLGTNEPYWSLGFEVPYYLLFAAIVFLRGWFRLAGVGLWLLLVGPKIALYAPLWLLGVAVQRLMRFRPDAGNIPPNLAYAALATCAVLYIFIRYPLFHTAPGMFKFSNWQSIQESVIYYHLVGLVVALAILAASRIETPAFRMPPIAQAIRYGAGMTFTLYLCHQPLIDFLLAIVPAARGSTPASVVGSIAILVISALLAELGERRKPLFRRAFDRALGVHTRSPAGQSLQANPP